MNLKIYKYYKISYKTAFFRKLLIFLKIKAIVIKFLSEKYTSRIKNLENII